MIRNWTNVEGVSMSFFLVLLMFCLLQMSMAIPAYRAEPTRKAKQVLIIYGSYIFLGTLHILEILYRGMYVWDLNDTTTIALTLLSALWVYRHRRSQGDPFESPLTKSQIAMTTRGVPQSLQAIKIWMYGGAGYPGVSILLGNLSIIFRVALLILNRNDAKEDPNRKWLLAAEFVNGATWGLVSLVWVMWRIGWI